MTVESLYTGLSGLNAMGHNINVIGNNIANVNTTGFRASRATFDDIFYRNLFYGTGAEGNRGGINPRQIGVGTKLDSIDTIFTQGTTQTTGRLLDLAIQGKGFFVVQNQNNQQFLTRAGNFSLDEDGMIVDPGSGYRLSGWMADDNGNLVANGNPQDISIDFKKESKPVATDRVTAGGNFNAAIGEPGSGYEVSNALSTTNLQGLFDQAGNPFSLVNGDQIKLETGFLKLANPPADNQDPIDLSQVEIFEGKQGVIMSITSTTTIEDLKNGIQNFVNQAVEQAKPGTKSGVTVSYDSTSGKFIFDNNGENDLLGMRFGVAPRAGESNPPKDANRQVGELFVNEGDPNFTKTLDVQADSIVYTNTLRRADTVGTIDVFDSQGMSHTVSVGYAANTDRPGASAETTIGELKDSEGRFLIPGGVVPPKVEYSEPVLDADTNTAVFTATQVSNIVATQGIFSFLDGDNNLIAMRLSDGALSINGEAFQDPRGPNNAEFTNNNLDVTGSNLLNVPGNGNLGGLLGDTGFTEDMTLEDIRKNIEDRLNQSITQVANNIANLDAATTQLPVGNAVGFSAPADVPQINVELTPEGSFAFSAIGGSLGASASDDETINALLAQSAGGADQLGLMLDLAAKTRSVRISTIDQRTAPDGTTQNFPDNQVDNDLTDGGGVSGFVKSADPFAANLFDPANPAFTIGNTDFGFAGAPDTTLDPTADPPTGLDDSGVQLIALSSGMFGTSQALTDQRFAGEKAFNNQTSAFRALFNQRGYGIATDANNDNSIDRLNSSPVGIVARNGDSPTETNVIKTEKQTQNTVNYQIATPTDHRSGATGITGTLFFDSKGDFSNYGGTDTAPRITFDVDNGDPQMNGVDPISFELDMSAMTYRSGTNTAELRTQNGRTSGFLDDVSIGKDGQIYGSFTNGDVQTLGQIAIADVINEGGLVQEGGSYFTVGPNSGGITYLQGGLTGGSINSGMLELSNVDLAREFTNLIVAQRAYQANTRVILTGDQVLTEVVNLKR